MSDADPVERGRDISEIRDVYLWDHERLWRSIYAFSGSSGVADEAVAEAFAQALAPGEAIRDVTVFVWRSAFGLAGAEMALRRADPGATVHPPTTDTPGGAELAAVLSELDRLDDDDRRLLVWHHVGGWTAKEMAPALRRRTTTVRWRLRRAHRRVGGAVSFDRFDEVPVPDQWDDVLARVEDAVVSSPPASRSRRPLFLVVGIIAVVALVGAFVVVVTGSPAPIDDTSAGGEVATEPAGLTATIGDGQEVTLAMRDAGTGRSTGTFRLRLYETAGSTFLEYEDIDVAAGDDAERLVVDVDGRRRAETPYAAGSIDAIRLADGTVTDPFTVRLALRDADGEIVQTSGTVLLSPET